MNQDFPVFIFCDCLLLDCLLYDLYRFCNTNVGRPAKPSASNYSIFNDAKKGMVHMKPLLVLCLMIIF